MSEGYNYIGKRYVVLVRASSDKDGTTSTEAQLAMLHAKAQDVRDISDLHYCQGLGGMRIADVLNRHGILSPYGKQWSQRQVEAI